MQKKKSGVKKCLEIVTIKGGGGVRRLMEKTILNFHFDYLIIRLREPVKNYLADFVVFVVFDSFPKMQ